MYVVFEFSIFEDVGNSADPGEISSWPTFLVCIQICGLWLIQFCQEELLIIGAQLFSLIQSERTLHGGGGS